MSIVEKFSGVRTYQLVGLVCAGSAGIAGTVDFFTAPLTIDTTVRLTEAFAVGVGSAAGTALLGTTLSFFGAVLGDCYAELTKGHPTGCTAMGAVVGTGTGILIGGLGGFHATNLMMSDFAEANDHSETTEFTHTGSTKILNYESAHNTLIVSSV